MLTRESVRHSEVEAGTSVEGGGTGVPVHTCWDERPHGPEIPPTHTTATCVLGPVGGGAYSLGLLSAWAARELRCHAVLRRLFPSFGPSSSNYTNRRVDRLAGGSRD